VYIKKKWKRTRLVVVCVWVRIHCDAVFIVIIIIITTIFIIIVIISFCECFAHSLHSQKFENYINTKVISKKGF
jgi:hypothetical protein